MRVSTGERESEGGRAREGGREGVTPPNRKLKPALLMNH